MSSRTANFCIDAHDPIAQARWWDQVIDDFSITDDCIMTDDEAELIGPAGRCLEFLKVPEVKTVKNRMHICLRPVSTTVDAEVERILALGASLVDDRRGLDDGGWVVLADPEGNEFCVLDRTAEQVNVRQA
ncbi:VOC family protein [Naumannella halotolerans]|uniref:VOC family protein n=1 Tax=Naumannella halotolerans TaxID=993414 RepID=UPI00370D324A